MRLDRVQQKIKDATFARSLGTPHSNVQLGQTQQIIINREIPEQRPRSRCSFFLPRRFPRQSGRAQTKLVRVGHNCPSSTCNIENRQRSLPPLRSPLHGYRHHELRQDASHAVCQPGEFCLKLPAPPVVLQVSRLRLHPPHRTEACATPPTALRHAVEYTATAPHGPADDALMHWPCSRACTLGNG
jgi:hypothetical protein